MTALEQGREAYRKGYPRSYNPYNRGTSKYVAFVSGWNLERLGK